MSGLKRIAVLAALTATLWASPFAPYETVASTGIKADRVLVLKEQRKLFLYQNGRVIDAFRIALGPNPKGPKVFRGDGRTPEGTYTLTYKNDNSRFYRSIRISYPNDENRALARRFGISPGGDIMIHGQPNHVHDDDAFGSDEHSAIHGDWTEGCIAVTNAEMDRIWAKVDAGTPIEIRP